MFGLAVLDLKLAVGYCRRDQKRARLYTVGDDRMLGRAQGFDALDRNRLGARAAHARAHAVEQVREVSYLWLARGVSQSGRPACRRGRHQKVLSPRHSALWELNVRADQAPAFGRARDDVAR